MRYGSPTIPNNAALFHARAVKRFPFKNWPVEKWEILAKEFRGAVSIGSKDDLHIPGTQDARGLSLSELMDLIASSSIVIGQSSGVMHLASMCGTPHLVWGDNKTYFNEHLEKRYKETWNPFNTPVTWIPCDNWNPEPEQILDSLKPKNVPPIQVLSMLHEAIDSGKFMIAVAHVGEREGKEAVFASSMSVEFPDQHLDQAEKQLAVDIKKSISKVRAERRPISWV